MKLFLDTNWGEFKTDHCDSKCFNRKVDIHTYMYTYIHIYIYTYIYTIYTYTYILSIILNYLCGRVEGLPRAPQAAAIRPIPNLPIILKGIIQPQNKCCLDERSWSCDFGTGISFLLMFIVLEKFGFVCSILSVLEAAIFVLIAGECGRSN